ncbi:hypothetical protein CS063_10280 [Sporanaerobium hydrogeniformans]|uniref:Uncharacterized protein n=1 Tax=Sporanaerobium hydrogeniformans TaxID=3072179 RepID=A0AC61DBR4_9FIRM|nr:hypothetical protein [Sporanaerobium hydrogeniformans]PHV70467.1 hypothetical protein CS063_10280 [Sporanaerobium hydrogeniformans]
MKRYHLGQGIGTLLFFLIMIGVVWRGIQITTTSVEDKGLDTLNHAIRRAVVQCYAIEGMYPRNIGYIEDNYGIMIDTSRYIVHYEIFASNIMPDITVLTRGGGEKE